MNLEAGTGHREAGAGLAPPIDWTQMGPTDHFVQFYEDDEFLLDSIAGFFITGFRAGESGIIVATSAHRATLDERLQQQGLQPATLRASGKYVVLDAAETLATFMVNGMPDRHLFELSVGGLVRKMLREGGRLRAFGEMVALLCNEGKTAAAIRLEELWNELAQSASFSLFCAYPMSAFEGEQNGTSLPNICAQHSQVIPTESYARHTNAYERLRTIAVLQQKAASLETQIAERKCAQNALHREQTRLEMAVAVAKLGIWELDLVTNEFKCSEQCKAHFGTPANEDLTHERLFELIHPDERDEVRTGLRSGMAGGRDFSTECRVLDKDGAIRWLSMVGRCFHNGEHRIIGVTLDITERKQASETLERTVAERTAKLKEMVGELESFSYSISHDMRAPLRSMQGFAAILLEDWGKEMPPQAKACLERITASAARMDRLIQDVLTFSRIARADFSPENVDLQHLVKAAVDSYTAFQAPQAAVSIAGKLPHVLGNQAGLTQCVVNLLSNAAKFVAAGVTPRIKIWSERSPESQDRFVRLCVEDNGVGIPPESQQKVFEIFHRLSTKYEGTGIGLAIVKKAVERMGGKVGLKSKPGEGSTFWLDLPLPQ